MYGVRHEWLRPRSFGSQAHQPSVFRQDRQRVPRVRPHRGIRRAGHHRRPAVESGDIVYGDRYGVLTIPSAIADDIPATVARMREEEQRIIDLCQSPDFSLERLRTVVRQLG